MSALGRNLRWGVDFDLHQCSGPLGAGIGELGIRIDLKILQLSGFFGKKKHEKTWGWVKF